MENTNEYMNYKDYIKRFENLSTDVLFGLILNLCNKDTIDYINSDKFLPLDPLTKHEIFLGVITSEFLKGNIK